MIGSLFSGGYPRLWVHDGRHSGSITIGRSRLPINAILPDALAGACPRIAEEWDIPAGFGESDLVEFLCTLLDVRGEFARLLLTLAAVEKHEWEHPSGKAWWETRRKQPVADALRRCLATLGDA